ncbi:MAG: PilZ domain-containing protein [Magnetococcus sp. YQC-5]
MEARKEATTPHWHRRCERVWFNHYAVLEFPGGNKCIGMTRDISLRGLFLSTDTPPIEVTQEMQGILRTTLLNEERTFPCRVVHVSQDGVGIELYEKGENLSASLAVSMVQETQVRLGTPVAFEDYIRIALVGKPTSSGRMTKISITQMEFAFIPSSEWNFKIGSAIKLEIHQLRHGQIVVDGIVRSVMPGDAPPDKICFLVFSDMSEKTVNAIKELVYTLHRKRLQAVLTKRSATIGLQAGADQPSRPHQEVRQELERFFGARRRARIDLE